MHPVDPSNTETSIAAAAPAFNIRRFLLFAFIGRALLGVYSRVSPPLDVAACRGHYVIRMDEISPIEIRCMHEWSTATVAAAAVIGYCKVGPATRPGRRAAANFLHAKSPDSLFQKPSALLGS